MLLDQNYKDIPTKELWEKIEEVNRKTMIAPPHLRPQLYNVYQVMMNEYVLREDK